MKKDWVMAYGIERFYLTAEEADYITEQMLEGKQIIILKNGMRLFKHPTYIIPMKSFQDAEKIQAGRWECDSGNWHERNAECFCNSQYITEGNTIKVISKPETDIEKYGN
jgi:hypothetical protein